MVGNKTHKTHKNKAYHFRNEKFSESMANAKSYFPFYDCTPLCLVYLEMFFVGDGLFWLKNFWEP